MLTVDEVLITYAKIFESTREPEMSLLMGVHPIYVLEAGDQISPVFESPLGLFNPEGTDPMPEDRVGLPRRHLTGRMSPRCINQLNGFDGDISHSAVKRGSRLEAQPL